MNKKLIINVIIIAAISISIICGCNKDVSVSSVSLNIETLILDIGSTETLVATVSPKDASNKSIIWESSNQGVASVLQNGLVTALSSGTTTIVVSTNDGGKSTSCIVTVRPSGEPDLVFVEGGYFKMGCIVNEKCNENEDQHPFVTLSDFSISKYPITQAQWVSIMGDNPSWFDGDNLPVECVSWNDVQEFIERLNLITGKRYRLPTEAEWEYAARGGNQSSTYFYSGSDEIEDVAWYLFNSNRTTHPVGFKLPNILGIYDMSGNVWEWCSDWYADYSSENSTDPTGPQTGNQKVFRGGSWWVDTQFVNVLYRNSGQPEYKNFDLGFRLLLP
ncbi:MAG: SUMF1/EgtB/PvdO family nonheme iron enzyme [Marinilabiliaceae bacterium]|nr:SUMF1/EgtB/PvdO family nonheme iron enzyme [Marinilabiliaceae bacterium]